ncbi:hypothetical protein NDA18_005492 [Ustilago nuda]|nr:hypothetical protein NDA18_005492 [Ustilago nuda]
MAYNSHPSAIHTDAPREPPPQQILSRPPASYDHPPHHVQSGRSWSSHRAFSPPKLSPPKLPPPRNHPLQQPIRLPCREPTPVCNPPIDPPRPSSRDSPLDHYARRRRPSSQADVGHFDAEALPRSRLFAFHSYPPPPSVYAPPPSAIDACVRQDRYQRDLTNRYLDPYPLPPDPQSSRPDPNSQRHASVSQSFAPSSSSYPGPRPEHSQSHQSLPRHAFQSIQQDRRMSIQPVVAEPSTPPTWSSSRPQHIGKRPLPADYQGQVHHHPAAPPSRSYAPSLQPAPHVSPLTSHPPATLSASDATRPPLPAPAASSAHVGQQRRQSLLQPATPRLPATSENVESRHAHPSLGFSAPSAGSSALVASQQSLQPQRKRLRISRACDECRRRKTRCDIVGAFPGEPGNPLTISAAVPPLESNMEPKGEMLILQPCMNCRRSEVTCSYSKRPLKRGPSKGYIKDLERRLNSLESQIVVADGTEQTTEDAQGAQSANTSSAPPSTSTLTKSKVRTEDRISRLESVLARPSTAKSQDTKSTSCSSSRRTSDADDAHVKSQQQQEMDVSKEQDVQAPATSTTAPVTPAANSTVDRAPSIVASESMAPPSLPRSDSGSVNSKGKAKAKRRSAANSPSRTSDINAAEVKDKIVGSFLHATFPIVPFKSHDKGSSAASNNNNNNNNNNNQNNIARLEDRVLARALRLLDEPVEMVTMQQDSRSGTPSAPASKAPTHAAKVASLIGQASAGLGGSREELMQQASAGADGLRALRRVAHRLSGQEADLLMLCHLDHLRNGRNNNSALASAVSKLGSGSHVQNDRETYRRRTLLFMLDRWHALAFGTPHLLTGRFGMERHSFRSMKEALGDVSQSPLGDAVYEVLRCAIMLGQLNDLVQNNGGWKGISKSDLDALIHSATDENEGNTAQEPSSAETSYPSSSSSDLSEPSLLSTAALRYSLESLVRCYYALHTLPNAKDARVEEVARILTLAESVLVLGRGKTPISLQGKLIKSAIGPHVLAVTGVAFSWCLRVICMMVAYSPKIPSSSSAATCAPAASSADSKIISPTSFPLEFYRRKILDYLRMCGPFCLFSGGPPTSPASFAPVYLRLALYFNSAVSFASQLGSLVSPQSEKESPVHQDPIALGNEADNLLEMAKELGFLGYVLARTTQGDACKLLTGAAPTAQSQ